MGGVAIVLGSASTALPELRQAQELAPAAPVICVNKSLRRARELGLNVAAFATLHPEQAKLFFSRLDIEGLPLFTNETQPYAKFPWQIERERWGGTSGLFATQIALSPLLFSGVILAGVPIDCAAGANYPLHGKQWASGYEGRYRRGWMQALSVIRDRVRSMGGWTQEILGAPSRDWLSRLQG